VSTSAVSLDPTATDVDVSDSVLRVTLADGRELSAHSGDHERSIRSIMNTGSGDHEHLLAPT
jgi:hypothetical protein